MQREIDFAQEFTSQDVEDIKDAIDIPKANVNINHYHNYSTDEQVVGKWIDGRDVYEKTFTGLSIEVTTTTSWQNLVVITNIDNVIDAKLYRADMHAIVPFREITVPDPATGYLACRGIVSDQNRTISDIIVQYTKTS